ncbi:MAG TPA: hypothetical protein VGC39_03525 [Candidatus Methylacidiphilales bacterium]
MHKLPLQNILNLMISAACAAGVAAVLTRSSPNSLIAVLCAFVTVLCLQVAFLRRELTSLRDEVTSKKQD